MNSNKTNNTSKNFGFTLLEILVTLGVIVVISVPLTRLQVNILSYNGFFQNTMSLQDEARRTLQNFSSEARSAVPAENGAYLIGEAKENSFIFYRDINHNGIAERVRYFKEGNELKKGVIAPSGNPVSYPLADEKIITVAHNVKNSVSEPVFSYFDRNYDGQTSPLVQPVESTLVRLVKLNIVMG
ncbi:MAG: prepilin-type N-terminal cleavage/methylation domain-containing protein, partial [Candidatus Gracilibacteria bacterium]